MIGTEYHVSEEGEGSGNTQGKYPHTGFTLSGTTLSLLWNHLGRTGGPGFFPGKPLNHPMARGSDDAHVPAANESALMGAPPRAQCDSR